MLPNLEEDSAIQSHAAFFIREHPPYEFYWSNKVFQESDQLL
jgi:hypothetical protein